MNEQTVDPNVAAAAAGAGMGVLILQLVLGLLMLVSVWKVFSKAGQPGWAVLIPFYNLYVFLKIAGKPGWWMAIILLVPIANLIFGIMALAAFAKNFGKGGGFVVGLIFLPFIFYPILGFGSAQYRPVAS
jgi:ABC-type sulfate transport system permease subunit